MSPRGEAQVAILPFGPMPDARTLAERIAEPVAESAPHAFAAAMAHCPEGSACQVYHAIWQYLRLAEIVRSVRVDGPIYAAVAEQMARAGQLRRALVTASADYSMLAHLAYGARQAGVEVEFSVLDRCATSLHLNAWYAERNGLKLRTVQADILDYDGRDAFDLICTHSLLTLLPPERRGSRFERWRSLLAPDGRVCFSNRVWDHHMHLTHEDVDKRAAGMVSKVVQKLDQSRIPLPCPADEFAKLVTRYSERYGNQSADLLPLPLADIMRWAHDAGFDAEIVVPVGDVVADTSDQAPGPFPTERGPRMWFQLRRA